MAGFQGVAEQKKEAVLGTGCLGPQGRGAALEKSGVASRQKRP